MAMQYIFDMCALAETHVSREDSQEEMIEGYTFVLSFRAHSLICKKTPVDISERLMTRRVALIKIIMSAHAATHAADPDANEASYNT